MMTLYLILLKIALKMLSFNRAEPGQNKNRILIRSCQRAITRSSSFMNTAAPSGCLSGTRTAEDSFHARIKIGDLRSLVLKQLDCRNAWQGDGIR